MNKRFGYHMNQLTWHWKNPRKVAYLESRRHGKIEVPKSLRTIQEKDALANWKQRQEWEKYMNPKGLKPTMTSNFPKTGPEIDFVNHTMMLARSHKQYEKNVASFRHSTFLSKPEIKQYLMKLYGLNPKSVSTVVKSGRIVQNQDRTKWKKKDHKKSIVQLDFETDPELVNQ